MVGLTLDSVSYVLKHGESQTFTLPPPPLKRYTHWGCNPEEEFLTSLPEVQEKFLGICCVWGSYP